MEDLEMAEDGLTLIVGAGAIGRVLGAGLASAGRRVLLYDVDAALVERANRDGISVDRQGTHSQVPVEAIASLSGLAPVELVLVCVKSYVTAAAAAQLSDVVGEQTTVASLQNGWGNGDILSERFGEDRVVVGVTYNSATVVGDGVAHTGSGPTMVGAYADGQEWRAELVARTLESGGFEARAIPRVREEIWKKLILNAATLPTAALTGLAAGALGSHEQMLPLVDDVTREAVAVARALGFEIELDERMEMIHAVLERAGKGKASMLQDIEAGRRTEIDFITGAVVKAAREVGVDVPLHVALYALVRGAERSRGLS